MEKESYEQKLEWAIQQLKEGTREAFTSEGFKRYLNALALFHRYSLRNCVLIARQLPGATYVAGYSTWEKLERHVKRGEKGIRITAPIIRKQEVEVRGMLDKDGNPVKEMRDRIAYRPVYVFDISQTEGKPLPEVVKRLDFEVENYEEIRDALIDFTDCQVIFDSLDGVERSVNGYFSPEERVIHVRSDLPNAQKLKTLIHEIIHSVLHPETLSDKTTQEKEIESEGATYVVASAYLGIDTSDYSMGYVAAYAEGRPLEELTVCLENIKRASKIVIDGLNQRLNLEITPEEVEQQKEAETVRRFVNNTGIVADSVTIIDSVEDPRNYVIYMTNSNGTYQAELVLHGGRTGIEEALGDQHVYYDDFGEYLKSRGIGFELKPVSEGRIYDYWYNFETRELRVYSDGSKKQLQVLIAVDGSKAEERAGVLCDTMPMMDGNRLRFTTVNVCEDDAPSYIEELYDVSATNRDPPVVKKYIDAGLFAERLMLYPPCPLVHLKKAKTGKSKAEYIPDRNVIEVTSGYKDEIEVCHYLLREYGHFFLCEKGRLAVTKQEKNEEASDQKEKEAKPYHYERGKYGVDSLAIAYSICVRYGITPPELENVQPASGADAQDILKVLDGIDFSIGRVIRQIEEGPRLKRRVEKEAQKEKTQEVQKAEDNGSSFRPFPKPPVLGKG